MNRFALVLLAGLLIAALCWVAPWSSGDPVDLDPSRDPDQVEAPEAETPVDLKGEGLVSATNAEGADDSRRTLKESSVRVTGRLLSKGVELGSTRLHVHLGTAAPTNPYSMSSKPEKAPDRVVTTGDDGRFAFDVPVRQAGRVALTGGDLVWARRPPRFLGSEEDLELGDLEVHEGARLRGRVLASDDAPIEEASLHYMSYEQNRVSPRRAKSDSAGEFELRGLPGGQGYLTVSRKGRTTIYLTLEMELGKIREGLVIRLRRGVELLGSVVDDLGQPVAGVAISVSGNGKQTEQGYEYSNGSGESDARGEYRVTGLGGGPFSVTARAKGYVSDSKSKVNVQDGPVHLRLTRKGIVSGRLIDEAGNPIAGSEVYSTATEPKPQESPALLDAAMVMHGGEFMSYSVSNHGQRGGAKKTDADGRFTLEDVKPGKTWFVAKGMHRKAVQGPIDVLPGKNETEVRIEAARGAVVAVRVTDPDGEPLEGVRVTVRPPKKSRPRQSGQWVHSVLPNSNVVVTSPGGKGTSGRTDENGECELAGVEPGAYEIRATHKKFVPPEPVPVTVPKKGRIESSLAMQAGGSVSIRVVDHVGVPVADQAFRIVTPAVGNKKGKKKASGRTDSTGRATYSPLAPGNYEAVLEQSKSSAFGGQTFLWADLSGMSAGKPTVGEPVPFLVKADETAEIALVRPQMASLEGSIRDASGALANALVTLSPEKGKGSEMSVSAMQSIQRARTDSNGAYRFEALRDGKYKLAIRRKQNDLPFHAAVVIVGIDTHLKDVYLEEGTLEVTVTKDGKPISGVGLRLSPKQSSGMLMGWPGAGGSGRSSASTDAKGVARFEGIPPGAYRLRIDGKTFIQPKDGVEVVASGTSKHDLAVVAAATLRCECTPIDGGKPVSMFRYECTLEGAEKPKRSWVHGKAGTISNLIPGRYTVRVQRQGGSGKAAWSVPQVIDLKAGEPGLLRFTL